MKNFLKYYIIFLLSKLIATVGFGQEFVISKNTKFPYNLSSDVSVFEDSSANLSIKEVKKQLFKKNVNNWVLLPFSNQATWLKIELKNESTTDSTFYFFLENQLIRRTIFYGDNADSLLVEPFKDKRFSKLMYPNYRVNLKPNERQVFYIKFESKRGAYFKLQLLDSKGIEARVDSNKIRFGLMAGLTMMAIFIVFIIGFLVIKDNKSRAYAIYTLIRATSLWVSINVFGGTSNIDSLTLEKITFAFMSIYPSVIAFLALNILPFESLPKWVKQTCYGFIIINLLSLILLFGFYGPFLIKFLVILTIVGHSFFYPLFIYTLIKKINQYPFYAIPFLLGNFTNLLLNLRVTGILQFENIYQITILVGLTEIAVYVYYLSQTFRTAVQNQAEKLRNLGFEAEKAAKLEELDKIKTQFFTNISHEFRTPLTLLVGPIGDLQKKYPHEGIIATMQRNLQRLQSLINQILDLSKLEAGEMKANLHEVELANFLNLQFASFESLAQSKNIIFKYPQLESNHFALADTDKLEKIITNLLSNAFKFTSEGGRISTKLLFEKNNFKLEIEDTGIGIEPTRLDKIFDRFYQVEEHKNYEGTGIGLALVKELVDLLGGTIEVSSKVSYGTTFNLILPFTPLEKLSNPAIQTERKTNLIESLIEPKAERRPSEILTPIEPDGQPIMLIVEDNPDLRNYIASIFENQYQLIKAVDGEDGLAKATEFIPDVVISDLMMPKLDGIGLCEKLKNDERTNHIPVVMLTAKASLSDRLAGLEHGADDYLSKPFNKEELQIRVKNLVSQRAMIREKYLSRNVQTESKIEEKEPTIDELFIQKAQSVINKHLSESTFGLEEFADEMNLSVVQLRRKIKAISDQTIPEFIRNYRLEIAADLLKKSNETVSEIAYKVGFESLSYFSKVFQEKFGKAASEWK
ncbi:MAG: ATP-binding protein [Spirosomataceae bacterium]